DLEKESNAINASIRQSALMDDEKDFLEMYLYSILAYTDLKDFDTEQMKSYAENFLERYPSSYFVPYVNNVLLVDLKTSNFGFGAGFFTGFNFLSGNISSYFKSYLPLGLNVELGYKNLILKGEVSSSFSKLTNESFEYKNITWSSDSTPYILSGNINVAYRVLNTPRYKIAPFAGFGSHAINLSEKADKLLFRPGFQAGVDFDWQFAEANNYGDYYDAFSSIKNYTSWYLRVRLGYAQYRNDDSRFNGSMIFTRIAVGFYANPAVRINKKIKKE
ncbi:MAG TPA: hypothetical protein VHO90_15295, partial [Bacteroidales bacterium]|nr:hypothetical protein [Bacteroidales bacterium]